MQSISKYWLVKILDPHDLYLHRKTEQEQIIRGMPPLKAVEDSNSMKHDIVGYAQLLEPVRPRKNEDWNTPVKRYMR